MSQKTPEPMMPTVPNLDGDGDLFSRADPRSIMNLLPPHVGEVILGAYQKRPDLFGLDEKRLFQALKAGGEIPSKTENRLRLAFWSEYDSAQANARPMTVAAIYDGIVHKSYFYNGFLSRPEHIAWMLCPPVNYATLMEEALAFGLEKLRDILELDCTDFRGRPIPKIAELQAKIVEMLHVRVKGAVVQRVENRNLNLNVGGERSAMNAAMNLSMEDVQKRLKELRRRDASTEAYKLAQAEAQLDREDQTETTEVISTVEPAPSRKR